MGCCCRLVLLAALRAAANVDLIQNGAIDLEGDAPFLFARRGEPFNYAADWANSSLAREGCWVLRGATGAGERICYAPPAAGGAGHAPSIFDFLRRRAPLAARVDAATAADAGNFDGPNGDAYLEPVERQTGRGTMRWQSAATLAHGADQLDYLVGRGRLPADFRGVADRYRSTAAANVARHVDLDAEGCCYKSSAADHALQHHLHNTLVYLPPPARRRGRAALNPATDWARVEREFFEGRAVVVDDVLAPWALAAARDFVLEATVYNELKHGYVGAYAVDGMTGGVFATITAELRAAMPDLVGDLDLVRFWSYKYANVDRDAQSGIRPHGDMAFVNLNLWVTPDAASLDDAANGMTVFDHGADSLADFEAWQRDDTAARMDALRRETRVAATTVHYRCNRIVLFNSRLIHQTGAPRKPLRFAPGYANRRVNLTWLFGRAAFAARKPGTVYDGRGRFVAAPAAPTPESPPPRMTRAAPDAPLDAAALRALLGRFDDVDPPPATARRNRRSFSLTEL